MDEQLRLEVQQAADELFIERWLPYEQKVRRVEPMTLVGRYMICFLRIDLVCSPVIGDQSDSRLRQRHERQSRV